MIMIIDYTKIQEKIGQKWDNEIGISYPLRNADHCARCNAEKSDEGRFADTRNLLDIAVVASAGIPLSKRSVFNGCSENHS